MSEKPQCLYVKCTQETSNPKFCSLSCGAKQQALDTPRKKPLVERTCHRDECSNTFHVSSYDPKQYCSKSCSAMVNNVLYVKRTATTHHELICGYCGKEFTVTKNSNKQYCSTRCSGKNTTKRRVQSWLDGTWDGTAKTGLSRTIRDYLLEEANYRCQSPTCCVEGGWGEINPITGKSPVEIDHIDGDAYNNKRENLIVLCPNCHALTSTYRALNRKGQRKYRKNYT